MSEILNVEIKSRCKNSKFIKSILEGENAVCKGCDHQIDTYFDAKQGRMKLREGNVENSLIYYERDNKAESRESRIILEKLAKASNIGAILKEALIPKIVVDKQRHIYFIDNIKFHIDEVEGLGDFIEIEAIDETGTFTSEELKAQCDLWIKKFDLEKKDFMNLSYSDLVGESFEQRLRREAEKFLAELFKELDELKFDVSKQFMDHLCYRVTSTSEYEWHKNQFDKIAKLLIESEVGGRQIATYKLNEAIQWGDRLVEIIELPSPKPNNKYANGFEHAEFVIAKNFAEIMDNYSELEFDKKALAKDYNADLRLPLASGASIKLHHQSLEDVIEHEKSMI